MNWRAYFTLLQPKPLLLALVIIPPWLLMLHSLLRLPFGEQKPVITAFAWWAVMLPLGAGGIFTHIIHAPMHRPFSVWLPDARRRLAVWQAGVVGCGLLLCTAMACFWDRTLPYFPVAGIVAAGFTLFLPWNNTTKGARAAVNVSLILGVSLSAIIFPEVLHSAALSHPWLSGFAGWGIALACFSGGFARARCRDRVRALNTSPFPISSSTAFSSHHRNATGLPLVKNPSPWTITPADGSLLSWLHVVRYERIGKDTTAWLKGVFYVWCMIVLVALLLSLIFPQTLGKGLYQTIWAHRKGSHNPTALILLFSCARQAVGLLRPSFHYPISRARQAKVTYLDSLESLGVMLVAMAGALLVVAWLVAFWQGWPTPFLGAVRFIMLFAWMVPFMALTQWGGMHQKIRNDTAMAVACTLLGFVPALITMTILWHSPRFLVSPGGVVLCLVLIGASQYAFYAALRRFYREGDLLQRGTKRQNLGLV